MKLEYFWEELERMDEANIKGMKQLAKKHKDFVILFHMDTDGVMSAITMKHIMQNEYRLKLKDARPIQYGNIEYAIRKVWDKNTLVILVDFAHGKPFINIWTDHHAGQSGLKQGTSTSFVDAPANAYHISSEMSKRLLSPMQDLEIVSTVDAAQFYDKGLSPDDIMRASFNLDKSIDVKGNHERMGLVVNKLLLSYKNKPDFLSKLVKNANPSLISMYNVIRRIAKDEGYDPPEEIEKGQAAYNQQQAQDIAKISSPKGVEVLDNGESAMLDGIVAQYGGGSMGMNKGKQFDRYTAFKNHPDANFLIMLWPMGLLQVSENPFKEKTGADLLDLVFNKVLPKYESKWKKEMVSLAKLKKTFEMDIEKKGLEDAIGFTFDDLIASFDNSQIKGIDIEKSDKWKNIVQDITNKNWKELGENQRDILSKIKISAWDIITTQSGGHKSIANLTNLWALGSGYIGKIKEIGAEIMKELRKQTK